jgi:hypothetical protein
MTQKIDYCFYGKVPGKCQIQQGGWGFRAKNQDGFLETYFCPSYLNYSDAVARAKKYFRTASVIYLIP